MKESTVAIFQSFLALLVTLSNASMQSYALAELHKASTNNVEINVCSNWNDANCPRVAKMYNPTATLWGNVLTPATATTAIALVIVTNPSPGTTPKNLYVPIFLAMFRTRNAATTFTIETRINITAYAGTLL